MASKIQIEILSDGQIRIETDDINPTMHRNADEFLKYIAELSGGKVSEQKKPHGTVRQQQQIKTGR